MVQGIAQQILSEQTPSQTPAQVTPTESEATQTDPKSTDTNDFDSRFGILAKMERKLKEQESGFRNKEKDWEEKGKKFSEYEELIKLLDENPLEALKKRKGWGVQEFNEFAVQNTSDEDLDPVAQITKNYETKMAELEKKLMSDMEAKIKAKEDEIAAKEHEGQIKEFKSGIKNFLAENKETYEFIHSEENGADSVYELIYEDIMMQKNKGVPDEQLKIMDIKDAAEKVETFLDKTYSKYLSLNKVKSKFSNSNEVDLGRFITKSQQPQTLNSSFSPKSKPVSQLSGEERKQSAVDLVRSWKQTQ